MAHDNFEPSDIVIDEYWDKGYYKKKSKMGKRYKSEGPVRSYGRIYGYGSDQRKRLYTGAFRSKRWGNIIKKARAVAGNYKKGSKTAVALNLAFMAGQKKGFLDGVHAPGR